MKLLISAADSRRFQTSRNRRTSFAFVCLQVCLAIAAASSDGAEVDFQRDVRPTLSNHCFKCHGPDEGTREADLRLDTAEAATADRGGYQAIVPGDAAASAIIERMETDDADLRMPPDDSGLTLTPAQIALVRRWIDGGAVYQPHWAFRPITRPALPQPNANDWVRNPIDAFVLSRQQAAGIQPSPEADRQTLIRRVFLDLLGLPPAPEQVDAFLRDQAPDAFERLVDSTLASPRYGERWARHWLDQARYADTNGYTVDSERSIWPYRDWVIKALNRDLPFDRFTIEQLAGDLLPNPTQDQLIATGFHRNTLVNQEGGVDAEQFRNEAVMDRVNTTGAVWLGLTVGCAQCHTHKYDPITLREYYQLFAFFNSSRDVNSVTPTIQVAGQEVRQRLEEFDRQIADAKRALAEHGRKQSELPAGKEPSDGKPVEWLTLAVDDVRSLAGATWQRLEDGSVLVGGENGDRDDYVVSVVSRGEAVKKWDWLRAETAKTLEDQRSRRCLSQCFHSLGERITAIRLEVLTHPSLPQGGPGRAGNGNFVLNEIQLFLDGGTPVRWRHATADHSQKDYPIAAAIDGDPATGWAINVTSGAMNVNRTATLVLAEPLTVPPGGKLVVRFEFGAQPPKYNIGRFRLSATGDAYAKLDVPDGERTRLETAVKQLEDERKKFAAGVPTTMVMQELDKPRPSFVLIRGDFLRRGDPVDPDVPAVFPPLRTADTRPNRLDLARWLVAPENPLTARVTVNRVWMRYFGRGLVETENDFGMQGTPPTHPELLDWLAAEFIESGWSLKHLHRLIVTSATYRQSSHARADLAEIDPLNKLLARQTRIRVEAEIVRDVALAVSGLLDDRIGGPSVYPPQPGGVYAFTQRSAAWPTSQGPDRYRRGLYTFFMRSAPYPMLSTFDSPDFNTVCTRRASSNTPLQSLAVANDQAMIELAQAFARRLLAAADNDSDRLEDAYHICFSRSPTDFERQRLMQYLDQQRGQFAAAPEDAQRVAGALELGSEPVPFFHSLAAWTSVARVLINLDEFITRE